MRKFTNADILTLGLMLLISASSCQKCFKCTSPSGNEIEACEADYGDHNEVYDQQYNDLQAVGYDCKEYSAGKNKKIH